MARGWESKAIESQQADAFAPRESDAPADAGAAHALAARHTLQLARTETLTRLQQACHPAHRAMLEQAIADLDRRIAELG